MTTSEQYWYEQGRKEASESIANSMRELTTKVKEQVRRETIDEYAKELKDIAYGRYMHDLWITDVIAVAERMK